MGGIEELKTLTQRLAGRAPVELVSLKGGDGRLGGVDPRSAVYRARFADGSTAVLKVFASVGDWLEEGRNLQFLLEIAPEHAPRLLAHEERALLLGDLGDQTLATLCASDARACREAWLLWAEALATVHVRAAARFPELYAFYAPDQPRVAEPVSATRMSSIVERLALETRGLSLSASDLRELAGSLRQAESELREWREPDSVFGFDDPNPMNAAVYKGRIAFIDVGGPALGLAARAFSEVWRAPEPAVVVRRYVEKRTELGDAMTVEDFEEQRAWFEIASCIAWLERHLDAAAERGIPDIDGVRRGYKAAEAFNLDMLLRLTAERRGIEPLRNLVLRIKAAPMLSSQ